MKRLLYLLPSLALLALSLVPPTEAGEQDRARAAFAFQRQAEARRLYEAGRGWLSPVPFPDGMERYRSETHTQSIVVLNDRDSITRVPIRRLRDRRWHGSGGLVDVDGWRSEKYRLLPTRPKTWIGNIAVKNSDGYFQNNRGIKRSYPEGTRFDDVLYNDRGEVFEHRSRSKREGKWTSEVLYKDSMARPKGYEGLKVSCASCHDEAGSGEYGLGLVPGSDTVLSDPVDWSVAGY